MKRPNADGPGAPAPAPLVPEISILGPLCLWLVVQFLAVLVSAARIPLWARFPQPGELLALQMLLVTQVASAALLFPTLLRDARTSLAITATSVPFLAAAAALGAQPVSRLWPGFVFLAGWLAGLSLWRGALAKRKAEMLGVAVFSAWTLGGPVLLYLRVEFARSSLSSAAFACGGPILGVLAETETGGRLALPWVVLGVVVLSGLATAGTERLLRRSTPQK